MHNRRSTCQLGGVQSDYGGEGEEGVGGTEGEECEGEAGLVGRVDGEEEEGGEVMMRHGKEGMDQCFMHSRSTNFTACYGLRGWCRCLCIAARSLQRIMYDTRHSCHRSA